MLKHPASTSKHWDNSNPNPKPLCLLVKDTSPMHYLLTTASDFNLLTILVTKYQCHRELPLIFLDNHFSVGGSFGGMAGYHELHLVP